ncbi:MAG: PIG-L family deacetylase [Candidatus Omnitrophica bacterium]|nr:PIG-L family deacetylase [Candidatus Omnitrophota bacterium]
MKKVLVVAPHMDDEVLGMGATIAKHVAAGDEVHVCIIAHRVYDHKYDEETNREELESTKKAKDILGYQHLEFLNLPDERLDGCVQDILIPLEKYYNELNPDILYVNFYGDNNQDHRAVFSAVRILIRSANTYKVPRVLMYEVPSSTDQSPPIPDAIFVPNFYVDVSGVWQKKIEAFHCYQRERRVSPHPRSDKALDALVIRRGVEGGFERAEGFMLLRDEWK